MKECTKDDQGFNEWVDHKAKKEREEMSYTKGPWKFYLNTYDSKLIPIFVDNDEVIHIAHVGARDSKLSDEEILANAKLTIAAPDLLEALEELIQCIATDTKAGCIQRSMAMNEDLKTAFLAIIKAKGE